MFGQRKRVEEDLARIRRANLPEEQKAAEERERQEQEAKKRLKDDPFSIKDLFAMIVAVLSLVLPYALAIVGVMGAVLLALYLLWGRG